MKSEFLPSRSFRRGVAQARGSQAGSLHNTAALSARKPSRTVPTTPHTVDDRNLASLYIPKYTKTLGIMVDSYIWSMFGVMQYLYHQP